MPQNQNAQCIHCAVSSCEFHCQDGMCGLNAIRVAPRKNDHSGENEESLCQSYSCRFR